MKNSMANIKGFLTGVSRDLFSTPISAKINKYNHMRMIIFVFPVFVFLFCVFAVPLLSEKETSIVSVASFLLVLCVYYSEIRKDKLQAIKELHILSESNLKITFTEQKWIKISNLRHSECGSFIVVCFFNLLFEVHRVGRQGNLAGLTYWDIAKMAGYEGRHPGKFTRPLIDSGLLTLEGNEWTISDWNSYFVESYQDAN